LDIFNLIPGFDKSHFFDLISMYLYLEHTWIPGKNRSFYPGAINYKR
jgi:hypothetical protein